MNTPTALLIDCPLWYYIEFCRGCQITLRFQKKCLTFRWRNGILFLLEIKKDNRKAVGVMFRSEQNNRIFGEGRLFLFEEIFQDYVFYQLYRCGKENVDFISIHKCVTSFQR